MQVSIVTCELTVEKVSKMCRTSIKPLAGTRCVYGSFSCIGGHLLFEFKATL
jgi:hypothetical protein